MAITVRGKVGEQLARLQEEVSKARRRAAEAERALATARDEATELDARLAQLEGQQMAGQAVEKEIKETTKALRQARERSGDEARRELVVLREAEKAHQAKVATFISENRAEIEAALREEAEEVVRRTEEHLRAALASKEAYMAVYQSFSEFLQIFGNSAALPSADGAHSYYRDLERFAQNPLRVPTPTSNLPVAA